MTPNEQKGLNKTISYALRHGPEEFDLTLDAEGWAPVQELLESLRQRSPSWAGLQLNDITALVTAFDKQRFEIQDGKIRALYGHSVEEKIQKQAAAPPALLYHGTPRQALEEIKQKGLRPMGRQYVHLSALPGTALQVGQRRDGKPLIITVKAAEAHAAGIAFYPEQNGIWLSEPVPVEFLGL